MKKIFGELNLTWIKLILFSVLAGVFTALMAMVPIVKDTSFSDLTVTLEVWILFGILIIMNSKSPLDSALKCFVFFLISQPLVYIIQDAVNNSHLFATYYRYWFIVTLLTFPMGFVGYYMKKDKWWGLIILAPMLFLVGVEFGRHLSMTMYSFPRHLLTTIFCFVTMIIYPIGIFSDKKVKIVGVAISLLIIGAMIIATVVKMPVYDTTLFLSAEDTTIEEQNEDDDSINIRFDDTFKAYLKDESYGELYFKYIDNVDCWGLNARFKKAGKTEFVLESPNGEKTEFDITIKSKSFVITKK